MWLITFEISSTCVKKTRKSLDEFARYPWMLFQFERPPWCRLFPPVTSKRGIPVPRSDVIAHDRYIAGCGLKGWLERTLLIFKPVTLDILFRRYVRQFSKQAPKYWEKQKLGGLKYKDGIALKPRNILSCIALRFLVQILWVSCLHLEVRHARCLHCS